MEQVDLLAGAAKIDGNLDPDARDVVITDHTAGAASIVDDDADEFSGNENNRRVALRMGTEKERLRGAIAQQGKPAAFFRAGDPLNPDDISAGGMGGQLGGAAQPGTSDAADAVAHAKAWDTTKAVVAAIKRAPTPPGGGDLLGDDAKPKGDEPSAQDWGANKGN